MGLILDTNALSATAEGEPKVTAIVADARQIEIPVIVLGQYRFGIIGSKKHLVYERWLSAFESDCWVLPVDQETAGVYALIREELKIKGRQIPSNDVWIAALAKQHKLPILSRDRHFDFVSGLNRVNW